MFIHLKWWRANIFIIDVASMELWHYYIYSTTKFVGVLLVFLVCAHVHKL
jgi:hypothetical protein